MKVLVVNNMAPFIWGGAEELAVHLRRNLEVAGHDAEILRIPFQTEPASTIVSQMLMCRRLEMINVDRVIALKFPAYLVRHPNKVIWCLHQYRQAYDLFDPATADPGLMERGAELKNLIHSADVQAFTDADRVFTNSPVTAKRLHNFNGISGEVLYPPVNDPELFVGGTDDGYIFAGGRINSMKRQRLLIEALVLTPDNVRLVIAGPADSVAAGDELAKLAGDLGVNDRLTLDVRMLGREELADWVNGATACAYIPVDEDSLGYVAMEGATAGKALITATDSGGVLGLVDHGTTGWVVQPTPEALAEAMTAAVADRIGTRRRGKAAREAWDVFGVTWPATIERLLA